MLSLGPDKVGQRWRCDDCGALWEVVRCDRGSEQVCFRRLDPEPGQRVAFA